MALSVIYIPETGESWDNAWEASEYGRKGKMALSLTGYDTASAPLIASGSWCEVVGSIFTTSGQQSVSGTPATGLAYIKMVTSGATSALVATPTWTATAPAWSDTYQGYYIDTYRAVAGCYYGADGTDYSEKWIYQRPENHFYTRASGSLRPLKCKVLEIGDWDMDSDAALAIEHGLTKSSIISVDVLIHRDDDNDFYPLWYSDAAIYTVGNTHVSMSRAASGTFDSVNFNATSYNRGYIIIWYAA